MAAYRIERIDDLTLADIANDTSKKQQLVDALNAWSNNEWATFQITETTGGLLLFLSHS
jgi:hypothetical protein